MSRQRSSASSSSYYQMSAAAHASLIRTRDHLRLLARLSAARIVYDAEELQLTPDALAASFHRLADDLDGILGETRCSLR
ncbi:hypothetical protein QLQ15_06490 [Lysobacter sp. LF1]|uniref:XAC0095-like domain-containing protein n=1 Tax=Lysobacter stagni TaxID=3045172 RepID=A0ABT6XES3_9GAMM|nr:hypothetical protein [Lysobacter sp. LF1]MDI9238561.1 hypothetical protein [Lysobacter sp. LF1]